jgi:tetratricopeptide (TPR) repeat protein
LSLLLYLARHLAGSRILILGTYRDTEMDREHPLMETLRELIRERLADEVTLRRLAGSETGELVRAQLRGASVSDELVTLVHGRAEGNPFFTEELVKALVERGVVSQAKGRWQAAAVDEIEVPRGVRSVVDQRVSRLAGDVQELLRLASVFGQEFALDALLAVSGRPESDVLHELEAALAAGLVEEQAGVGVERYRFAHALIHQTLYEELPGHRRRRLHRRVGDALETLGGTRRRSLAAELSRHFLAAGDEERALSFTIQAGDQAASRYAHAEAARHYRLALDRLFAVGDLPRAADVQYRLARELYDLNRLADALAAYHAALGAFERLDDANGQARVHRGIGLVHAGRYDMVAAVPHFDAALRLWPTEREDAELAWLLQDAARASFFNGESARANSLAERAFALAEQCDDAGLLARTLSLASTTRLQYDPRPRSTRALLDRAERVARSASDWRALSYVYLVEPTGPGCPVSWTRHSPIAAAPSRPRSGRGRLSDSHSLITRSPRPA